MRLRNRRGFITQGPERTAPRRFRPRITQFIYLLILFAILAYVVNYTINYLLVFEARGQIVTETTVVSATRVGRIRGLAVAVGDRLEAGSVLASVQPPEVCESPKQRSQSLSADIALNEKRIAGLDERIRFKRRNLEAMALNRALELDGGADAREDRRLRESLTELRVQRETLLEETRLLRDRRRSLQPDPQCEPEVLTAPVDARVVARHRDPQESVTPGDPIITLQPLSASAQVLAYLPADERDSVREGDQVDVILPNGHVDTGRITRIRSSAEDLADTLWDGYRRERSELAIEIEPVAANDEPNWQRFRLMEVEVRGRRR